jgi:hypothetical protein
MNEIKAADVNTGYGARGVPAFPCRFGSKLKLSGRSLPHHTCTAAMKKASV